MKRPTQRIKEKEMAEAVARYLRPAVREVALDGHRFDVVAYYKHAKLFLLVECKRSPRATSIGRAFGQLVAYYAVVSAHGREFVNSISNKLHLSFNRLWEATDGGRQIRVAFYVALTEEACKRVELVRAIKGLLPHVGIIRVKRNGRCRDYIWEHGKRDYKLVEAVSMRIRILQSN